jgi:hypothetical protein
MTQKSLLSSPLLHFFILGGCLFAAFAVVDDTPPAPEPDAIVLSLEEAGRLVARFEQTWSRPPTPQELDGLFESWVLEEAYVREAIALGLDQNDSVIRQRLSLKMRFLAESAATAQEIDAATLQGHLDANAEKFRHPASLAFQQLQVPAGEASTILDALNGGDDPESFSGSGLLPMTLEMTRAPVIDRAFGTGFAEQIAGLPLDTWAGLVESAYGQHLVRVTGYVESVTPALEDIRDQVEADWHAARARESQDAFADALLTRYSVAMPTSDEVLSQ